MRRIKRIIYALYQLDENVGADRPKTQNQFLKVGTEHHNSDSIKSEVGMNKNIVAVQDMKMENDGQSETVFGQSGGGGNNQIK